MFFLVSVCTEEFRRMMHMRALYRQFGIEKSISRDAPDLLRRVRRSFGGRLILLDWSTLSILADTAIAGVSGIALRDDTVIACSWIDQCVYELRGAEKVATISHPWFNHIHSVDITPKGTFLLASAGTDLIVEMTPEGQVVWEWFGPEHGYNTQPGGMPVLFDRGADYRPMGRATTEQAMHVTSAILLAEREVLATLFHQGQLISIDYRTGNATTRLDKLCRPHSIHRRQGGFILSDTLGHRILLIDDELKLCSEIACGSQWLQEAICTSAGTYFALENVHIDQLPESGLNNRMSEIDDAGTELVSVEIAPDYRLFAACEVNEALARELARAWRNSGDVSLYRRNQKAATWCARQSEYECSDVPVLRDPC